MALDHADAAAIAAVVPLDLDLEPYRARLTPLALAVLSGSSARVVDRRRALVIRAVWDERFVVATRRGLDVLRAELERKLSALAVAREELEKPARRSALAAELVDRLLADLLDANDANVEALEALNHELEVLPPDERRQRAALAARGALTATPIPPNELRAAVTSAALAARDGDADAAARAVARRLGSRRRQAAVREWATALADQSAEHVPTLAAELRALASDAVPRDPGDDLLWVQACIGLTLEIGRAGS